MAWGSGVGVGVGWVALGLLVFTASLMGGSLAVIIINAAQKPTTKMVMISSPFSILWARILFLFISILLFIITGRCPKLRHYAGQSPSHFLGSWLPAGVRRAHKLLLVYSADYKTHSKQPIQIPSPGKTKKFQIFGGIK